MPKKESTPVKNRVRELRARQRLTQGELANEIGVSRQTIAAIEKEEYNPSILLALKLATLFNEQVDTMFWIDTGA